MAPRRTDPGGALTRDDVGRLYVAGRDELFRLAWLTVGDAEVAEDLVQEAYTRLYEHPERVRDADRVEAYVRSIVLNLARTRFTRRSRPRRRPHRRFHRRASPVGPGARRRPRRRRRSCLIRSIRTADRRYRLRG